MYTLLVSQLRSIAVDWRSQTVKVLSFVLVSQSRYTQAFDTRTRLFIVFLFFFFFTNHVSRTNLAPFPYFLTPNSVRTRIALSYQTLHSTLSSLLLLKLLIFFLLSRSLFFAFLLSPTRDTLTTFAESSAQPRLRRRRRGCSLSYLFSHYQDFIALQQNDLNDFFYQQYYLFFQKIFWYSSIIAWSRFHEILTELFESSEIRFEPHRHIEILRTYFFHIA